MPIFDNPNDPQQPKAGVYRWYFIKESKDTTIYIGNASGPIKSRFKKASTLFRGIAEASMSHSYSWNTNVLVGQTIEYIEKKEYVCHWKLIIDDPYREKELVQKYNPIIQKSGKTILISKSIRKIKKEIDKYIN